MVFVVMALLFPALMLVFILVMDTFEDRCFGTSAPNPAPETPAPEPCDARQARRRPAGPATECTCGGRPGLRRTGRTRRR
ncbi:MULTISPECIES: hypothetical protein [unclassified Streptomyces]|uniref:hypothetical protein n=1 Tax=unclassified Streptomyces TaxID=2593676 RepID=UPI003D7603C8